jgi:hypothetical protein
MTEQIKIEGLRLGKRPTSDKPTLKVSAFLRAARALPTVPEQVDHLSGVDYGLYYNDVAGTCGPTSLANYVRMVSAKFGAPRVPSWEVVQALYRMQNPGFDLNAPGNGEDNGVEMKQMLVDAVRNGFGEDTQVLGFAEVNAADAEEIQACVAIFGGVLLGLDLDQAQASQLADGVWDYAEGSPPWGGHAVLEGAYETDEDEDIITWAQRCRMTPAFVANQRAEAYVVILADHLGSQQFLEGFDLQRFAQAYVDITGRPFPADITPPAPDPDDLLMTDQIRDWAFNHRHSGIARIVAEALKAWFRARGNA